MIVVAVLAATVASFVLSAVLYGLPPVSALIERTSTPRPGLGVAAQMGSVVVRGLLTAVLVAGLMSAAGWASPAQGALLGLALATLPAVLLAGGVVHEDTAVPAAVIHLLDWTLKLVVTGALIGLVG